MTAKYKQLQAGLSPRHLDVLGWCALLFALAALALSGMGSGEFVRLHLWMDAGSTTMALLLAVFLQGEQSGIQPNVRRYLAISFAATAAAEFIHSWFALDWTEQLHSQANILHPVTWMSSTYVLPLALLCALWLTRRNAGLRPALFAAGAALLVAGLIPLALSLPPYADTGLFGIRRPTLLPLVLLYGLLIAACWRKRREHPLYEGLTLMVMLLFLSNLCMLYSTSVYEKFALMAHAGKIAAYAALLWVIMRMAVLENRARMAAEANIRRLTQIYATLNQCNQAIMRCDGETELFAQICQAAVQSGSAKMAWVGLVDKTTDLVMPAASYGSGLEYLNGIRVSVDANDPAGNGMAGTAIREDRPVWVQDFQNSPLLAPWRERGAPYGWHASAALPLHRNGAVVGSLMMYANVTDAFDEAARNLLEGMAANIDIALDKFALDAKRKQAEDALRESEARTRLILDTAMDAVISADQDGTVIGWNREAEHVFGYAAGQALGKDLTELIVPPVHRDAHRQGMRRFVITGNPTIIGKRIEITGMRADGLEIPIELTLSFIRRDEKYFFNAFVRDLAERKQAEEDLRITSATFDSQESILITDRDANILRVNRAFEEMSGYSAAEMIGRNPRILQSGQHDAAFYRAMWSALRDTGKWFGEVWDKRKNGEIYPKTMTITAVYDQHRQVTHYVSVSRDITRRKKSEQEIHQLAFYDPLTRLPNRRLLMDRLQQATAVSARNGRHGALIFLDLDNFKTINDTQGHAVGDLLLIEAARRLQLCVREGDTVARLGGDEFVVVLEDMNSGPDEAATQTELVAEKIQRELVQPYVLDNFECVSTASIGIVLFRGHEESLDDLLKHADTAMYQAKTAGRNTIRFYDPAMQAALEARIELEGELRQALKKEQLRLYYQIQVDHLHRPLGAEVLLRWEHPVHGLVSPMQFIPLAEETGLIVPIGMWVLQTACEQLKAWQNDASTGNLTLAVNVSAKQFRQADFIPQVRRVLQENGAKPSRLKLELTESTVLENVEDTIAKMRELKILGVGFSMDDFGTGYSSLQYLKRLPLDQIKIDRSFVRDIATDPNDAAIVKTIIAMTEALGLDVIAEGVETEAQHGFLDKHGCHAFQGYLFGKPVPIASFEESLRGGQPAPIQSDALP